MSLNFNKNSSCLGKDILYKSTQICQSYTVTCPIHCINDIRNSNYHFNSQMTLSTEMWHSDLPQCTLAVLVLYK